MPGTVEYVNDLQDALTIKRDIEKGALNRYGEGQEACTSQVSIVQAGIDPFSNAVIGTIYKYGIDPSRKIVSLADVSILDQNDLSNLHKSLSKMKMEDMSSPFTSLIEDDDYRRPMSDLRWFDDHYVFDMSSIPTTLDGVDLEIELIGEDIARVNNVPLLDMDEGVIMGVGDLVTSKMEAVSIKREAVNLAKRILWSLKISPSSVLVVSNNLQTLFDVVDDAVEKYGRAHFHIPEEASSNLGLLRKMCLQGEDVFVDLSVSGKDVYMDVLSTDGHIFPFGIDDPGILVDPEMDYNIGSTSYLLHKS